MWDIDFEYLLHNNKKRLKKEVLHGERILYLKEKSNENSNEK